LATAVRAAGQTPTASTARSRSSVIPTTQTPHTPLPVSEEQGQELVVRVALLLTRPEILGLPVVREPTATARTGCKPGPAAVRAATTETAGPGPTRSTQQAVQAAMLAGATAARLRSMPWVETAFSPAAAVLEAVQAIVPAGAAASARSSFRGRFQLPLHLVNLLV